MQARLLILALSGALLALQAPAEAGQKGRVQVSKKAQVSKQKAAKPGSETSRSVKKTRSVDGKARMQRVVAGRTASGEQARLLPGKLERLGEGKDLAGLRAELKSLDGKQVVKRPRSFLLLKKLEQNTFGERAYLVIDRNGLAVAYTPIGDAGRFIRTSLADSWAQGIVMRAASAGLTVDAVDGLAKGAVARLKAGESPLRYESWTKFE